MIPLPGSIYFDPQFEFIDGKLGPKLFVVLCDSPREESAVIVARTTSQAKTDIVRACFSNMHPPNFCFPMQSNWFDEHTWILFDYIVSYESGILERWQEKAKLPPEDTVHLLECGAQSAHVEKWASKAMNATAQMLRKSYKLK